MASNVDIVAQNIGAVNAVATKVADLDNVVEISAEVVQVSKDRTAIIEVYHKMGIFPLAIKAAEEATIQAAKALEYANLAGSVAMGGSGVWLPGPKGDKGDAGPQGIQGDKGDTGDKGDSIVGPIGPQGNQGIQGIQGIKGDKGDLGDTGEKGEKGDTGTQGEHSVIALIPRGDFSVTAEPLYSKSDFLNYLGKVYVCKESMTSTNVPPSTGAEDDLYWQLIAFFGAKGDKGNQGEQGIQGLVGPQGIQGEQGLKGDQGIQGIQGNQGFQGLQGPPGIRGLQGLVGPKGDKGDAGIQGPIGLTGAVGPKGEKGDKGDQGDIGNPGPIGNAFIISDIVIAGNSDAPIGFLTNYVVSAVAGLQNAFIKKAMYKYKIQDDKVEVLAVNNKITLPVTIPEESSLGGKYTLDVDVYDNFDNFKNTTMVLTAVGVSVSTPVMVAPVEGALLPNSGITLAVEKFESSAIDDELVSVSWKISSDSAGNVVKGEANNVAPSLSYTFGKLSGIIDNNTYYGFCKQMSLKAGESAWSSYVSFKLVNDFVSAPTIILPVADAVTYKNNVTLETNAFQSTAAGDTHINSTWIIAKNIDGSNIVVQDSDSIDKTFHTFTNLPLTEAAEVYALARHRGTIAGLSLLSSPVKFLVKMETVAEAVITSPTANSTVYASGFVVTLGEFQVIGGEDTHVESQYKVTSDIDGNVVVVEYNGVNLIAHMFTLDIEEEGNYYIFARHRGESLGWGAWSSGVKVVIEKDMQYLTTLMLVQAFSQGVDVSYGGTIRITGLPNGDLAICELASFWATSSHSSRNSLIISRISAVGNRIWTRCVYSSPTPINGLRLTGFGVYNDIIYITCVTTQYEFPYLYYVIKIDLHGNLLLDGVYLLSPSRTNVNGFVLDDGVTIFGKESFDRNTGATIFEHDDSRSSLSLITLPPEVDLNYVTALIKDNNKNIKYGIGRNYYTLSSFILTLDNTSTINAYVYKSTNTDNVVNFFSGVHDSNSEYMYVCGNVLHKVNASTNDNRIGVLKLSLKLESYLNVVWAKEITLGVSRSMSSYDLDLDASGNLYIFANEHFKEGSSNRLKMQLITMDTDGSVINAKSLYKASSSVSTGLLGGSCVVDGKTSKTFCGVLEEPKKNDTLIVCSLIFNNIPSSLGILYSDTSLNFIINDLTLSRTDYSFTKTDLPFVFGNSSDIQIVNVEDSFITQTKYLVGA